MTDRLNKIFNELPICRVFADIGCDHGYIAKAMISSGKCKNVIVSDISEKCLEKARQLLTREIESGVATSVVSDGFDNVGECDCALIAGMGGEEIVCILDKCKNLPETLVLQPMKNSDKVRLCAVKLGYEVLKDFTFKSASKFYNLIILSRGLDSLTDEEIEFGRTNLRERPSAFKEELQSRIKKLTEYAGRSDVSEKTRLEMLKNAERLVKYVED